jgi:hypothetical protein
MQHLNPRSGVPIVAHHQAKIGDLADWLPDRWKLSTPTLVPASKAQPPLTRKAAVHSPLTT